MRQSDHLSFMSFEIKKSNATFYWLWLESTVKGESTDVTQACLCPSFNPRLLSLFTPTPLFSIPCSLFLKAVYGWVVFPVWRGRSWTPTAVAGGFMLLLCLCASSFNRSLSVHTETEPQEARDKNAVLPAWAMYLFSHFFWHSKVN